MAESRSPRQPNKPDKNEVWSWVVIAILFTFAWPVGLIVLFAKLSDRKRKSGRGAQSTIITAETEDTAETAAGSAEKKSSSAGQTKKKGSSILRRTPKVRWQCQCTAEHRNFCDDFRKYCPVWQGQ